MKISRRIFASLVLSASISLLTAGLLSVTGCATGKNSTSSSKAAPKPLRVLFVGNSYTYVNMLPEMLQQFSQAGKQQRVLDYRMIAPGGYSLEQHWNGGAAQKAIAEGGWDYVVLQEQSLRPITNSAKMFQYARLFDQEVRKSGARTVFYVTWARKNTPAKQEELTASYSAIATELGALSCPVGPAWSNILKLRPNLDLFQSDGSHPSPAGTYLAACVFYNVLYGTSPVGLPGTVAGKSQDGKIGMLAGLNEADAKMLQRAARQNVKAWAGGRRAPLKS